MTAISNRFAPSALNLPAAQAPASRAAGKPVAGRPADVVELKARRTEAAEPMLDLGAPPILPSAATVAPLPRDLGERLEAYSSEMDGGGAVLAWASMVEMARSATRDIEIAAKVRNAMQHGALEAKANEITKTEHQIAHERTAAFTTLAGTVAIQTVAVVLCSPQLSNCANAIMTAANQCGPISKANKQKLEGMHQDLTRQTFEMNVDSAKANYDEAREQFKLAMRVLSEHAERQTQISATITRI